MNLLRKLLFPFAVLYGFITGIRNFLYNVGILKSHSYDIPVIAVGNLSVGGTGKTPQIEYLIRLLSESHKIATLSRGYKRKSEGFVLADKNATAEILGDEPYQFFQKFPEIQVAVDANRKNGIERLFLQDKKPEIILLDDAFQHRKVKAGFYIMLTSYDDLFYNDFMLPTGNLRENRFGANRADVIIVTKCPTDISKNEQEKIKKKIDHYLNNNQPVFFSYIEYDDFVYSEKKQIKLDNFQVVDKIVVAGIAKPEPFFAYLQAAKKSTMVFPDHHNFTEKDIQTILETANGRKIVTTEKDFVRLKGKLPIDQLYYLPIKSSFVTSSNEFDKKILEYVGTSTGNR
ncbi:tetraacyldisaccharide 4'-kinase [Flavobacterium amniphilum]|uniref:tetraacyldisaccharide 4'-kinase n=1 Tax=Flavobacterium amniphilum TaxID=1834035 RepID=UPI00202A013D|nr:tetraacyldisaccharide 4'-kinase [Flavobacterium amniphilum]MCL9805051.1 tetraacyldisaccharide 4'-kinase [Flavobacterium amniphilum]